MNNVKEKLYNRLSNSDEIYIITYNDSSGQSKLDNDKGSMIMVDKDNGA